MSGISLTASMRSNLLSLQNISGQVSSTQNKLSTGNKVNSAIDNPSSYYTALSLNNRADDLNALLDSMGQAVSTIKAATTALESATEFLEQAKAVANQALETAKVPDKAFFEEKVGENGAVVTTAQELKDAVAAGKETICVYGTIDYFENENIDLTNGQKLVGTEYFTGYTGAEKFSHLNMSNSAICLRKGTVLSDLGIDIKRNQNGNLYGVNAFDEAKISNIDLNFEVDESNTQLCANIIAYNKLELSGNINLFSQGNNMHGIYGYTGSDIISQANIVAKDIACAGANTLDIQSGTLKLSSLSISKGNAIIGKSSIIHLTADEVGISISDATLEVEGKIYSQANQYFIRATRSDITIGGGAQVVSQAGLSFFTTLSSDATITFKAGSILDLKDNTQEKALVTEEDYSVGKNVSIGDLTALNNFSATTSKINWNGWAPEPPQISIPEQEMEDSSEYQEILNQYDALIKDASYKGINLLQTDKLSVKFNEDGESSLAVQGKDMGTKALGLTTLEWQSQGDINKSIEELSSAINSIRNYSSELGNNYNIITTRQDFTESLINVLTEGADKLTLADMNEESANMLALQTRQQLAINSLSLASQASQSILKLF